MSKRECFNGEVEYRVHMVGGYTSETYEGEFSIFQSGHILLLDEDEILPPRMQREINI